MSRYRDTTCVSADGLVLHLRDYAGPAAAAPMVLCLHGLMRNGRDFEDLAPRLRARFRVIVPDLRGRGLSDRDPNPQNYQPTVYLRDLLKILAETNGAAKIAIVGTSLGGILAMMLAHSRPALVAGIILNDVGPELDPNGVERIKGYAGRAAPVRDWAEAVAQTQAVYGTVWPETAAQRWAALARRGYREDAAGIPHADADPLIGEAMRSAPAAAPDLWPLWARLADLPILAIRGALSDILSVQTFERMRAEKPDLEQITVANRGHVPLLDEPECTAAIDAFLGRLFPPQGRGE